jgi:hypothetical protein
MIQFLRALWAKFIAFFVGASTPQPQPTRQRDYRLVVCADQAEAKKAIGEDQVIAVIRSADKDKWVQFRCPCGCGEVLMLNLMRSHSPCWQIEQLSQGRFSISPSVDSTKCGAHFWVRESRIVWAN